ncbi:hypothetical protein EDD15DRAFT_2194046 [Pisolithus albus]|nr:hypothetical protein EDD15DRAFT_2194046 [Pisolithus albus]
MSAVVKLVRLIMAPITLFQVSVLALLTRGASEIQKDAWLYVGDCGMHTDMRFAAPLSGWQANRPRVAPQHRSSPPNSTFRNDNVKGSLLDAFMMTNRPGVTPQHRSSPQNSTFRNDNVKGSPLDAFMMRARVPGTFNKRGPMGVHNLAANRPKVGRLVLSSADSRGFRQTPGPCSLVCDDVDHQTIMLDGWLEPARSSTSAGRMGDKGERSKRSRILIRATFLKDALLSGGLFSLEEVLHIAIVQVKSLCHKAKMGEGQSMVSSEFFPKAKATRSCLVSSCLISNPSRETSEATFESAHPIKADEDMGVEPTYEAEKRRTRRTVREVDLLAGKKFPTETTFRRCSEESHAALGISSTKNAPFPYTSLAYTGTASVFLSSAA